VRAVFSYSSKCPRTFAADVDSCNTKYLTNQQVLRFHPGNELVAIGNQQQIETACK